MISLICGIYNMEQMIVAKKKNKKQNKTDYGQEEPIRGSQGENGREWDRRAFGGVFLDAHCYIWNRWAMGPYCTAQGNVCDWVTLLYNRT